MTRAMKLCLFGALALLLAVPAFALVPGDDAPGFTLKDTDGKEHSIASYLAAGKVVVLEWFNPDCPFIIKHHKNHKTMNETYAKFADRGVVWLAINSNAPGKQGHGDKRNRQAVIDYALPFPLLLDENGVVGQAYGAKTTPHMFVIGGKGKVLYAGAIDDDRSAGEPGDVNYVADALEAVLVGKTPKVQETDPYGCSVKYVK